MLGALRVMPAWVAPAATPPVAGYIAWYDASDAATITESSGAVSQWDDKSGNGYHLTQSDGSFKPTTGARSQNGLNVLDFASDKLENASISDATPTTVFVVAALDVLDATRAIFDSAATNTRFEFRVGTGKWSLFTGYDSGDSSVSADTNPHVFAFKIGGPGANGAISVDGTNTTGLDTGAAALTGVKLGNKFGDGAAWDGWVGEVIIYDSALSDGDRESGEAYLATKWGTP